MDVKLVMYRESGQRKDFDLRREVTVIGRKEDCDLRIPLQEISRKHCEVSVARGAVSVKDLGSANGTYVNDERVTEQSLSPGDRLAVGPVVFTVQVDGEPAEIKPVATKLRDRAAERAAAAGSPANGEAGTDAERPTTRAELADAEPIEAELVDDIDPISALEALASGGELVDPEAEQQP